MSSKIALLGGTPAFPEGLPFARPTIEDPQPVLARIAASLESGMVTGGPTMRELEERSAAAFGVANCVAVSSATAGLMLVIQALDPAGPVLLPSFTFSATAHAVHWNHRPILFADCDPETWCLAPTDVYDKPALIIGVHVSGVPADVEGLAQRARELEAELMFDAAHGAGSLLDIDGAGRPLGGFGRAEVFSLTPTKVLSGAEGGLVTTNDAALAEHLRAARDYGNPGDYDTRFPGLNARLSELHAALGLASLGHLEERVVHRNTVAGRYQQALGGLPGLRFQTVPAGSRSSYKDFTVLVDGAGFGCSREVVVAALHAEGIQTRPYYSPPVHRQQAYAGVESPDLPVTDRLASQVISLPIWSHLPLETADRVGEALARIQANAGAIQEVFGSGRST